MELVSGPIAAAMQTPTGPLPLLTTFTYTDTDPAAVSVTFTAHIPLPCGNVVEKPVTWVFSRELLDNALGSEEPVGEGDIRIRFLDETDQCVVELRDDDCGFQSIYMACEPVVVFMTDIVHKAEFPEYDVDAAIAHILAGR